MSESIIQKASGTWIGTNKLWFEDPEKPEICDTKVEVSADTIEYTWSFRGEPQTGIIRFSGGNEDLEAHWTDTWHSVKPMKCYGQQDEKLLSLVGTYPAGEGPDWSWRTELSLKSEGELLIQMFNITPTGEEALAVAMECKPG